MIDRHGIDHFRPVTGLPISTYFSAFKVKWLLDNVAEVKAAVAAGDAMIGTVDSWLIYNLTGGAGKGVHVTDGTPVLLDGPVIHFRSVPHPTAQTSWDSCIGDG